VCVKGPNPKPVRGSKLPAWVVGSLGTPACGSDELHAHMPHVPFVHRLSDATRDLLPPCVDTLVPTGGVHMKVWLIGCVCVRLGSCILELHIVLSRIGDPLKQMPQEASSHGALNTRQRCFLGQAYPVAACLSLPLFPGAAVQYSIQGW